MGKKKVRICKGEGCMKELKPGERCYCCEKRRYREKKKLQETTHPNSRKKEVIKKTRNSHKKKSKIQNERRIKNIQDCFSRLNRKFKEMDDPDDLQKAFISCNRTLMFLELAIKNCKEKSNNSESSDSSVEFSISLDDILEIDQKNINSENNNSNEISDDSNNSIISDISIDELKCNEYKKYNCNSQENQNISFSPTENIFISENSIIEISDPIESLISDISINDSEESLISDISINDLKTNDSNQKSSIENQQTFSIKDMFGTVMKTIKNSKINKKQPNKIIPDIDMSSSSCSFVENSTSLPVSKSISSEISNEFSTNEEIDILLNMSNESQKNFDVDNNKSSKDKLELNLTKKDSNEKLQKSKTNNNTSNDSLSKNNKSIQEIDFLDSINEIEKQSLLRNNKEESLSKNETNNSLSKMFNQGTRVGYIDLYEEEF